MSNSKPKSFDSIFPRVSENFSFDNPALRILVQDAAAKTLTSPREDNKSKARKLFLLEKLSEPTLAPPVPPSPKDKVPARPSIESKGPSITDIKRRMDKEGSWAQQKKIVLNARNSVHVRERGASTVRKKEGGGVGTRPLSANYDPNATALQLVLGDSNQFFPVVTLAHESRLKNWGWQSRVQVMKDIAFQLKRLHENSLAHNSLLNDIDAMLVDSTTFRGTLADPSGSVAKCDSETEQKNDVFSFGKTLLTVACRGQFADPPPSFPSKHELKQTVYWDDAQISELDKAVRESLEQAKTPGSLLELCAQCCSLSMDLRPSAEDAWNWLDSILEDFEKAQQTDSVAISDLVKESKQLNLAFINSPRLIDLTRASLDDDDDNSMSTAPLSEISVASDESIVPHEILHANQPNNKGGMSDEEKASNRKSKLLDFLSNATAVTTTSAPSNSGSSQSTISLHHNDDDSRRPHSLNVLPNSTPSSNSAFSEADKPVKAGGSEAKESELTRRRSLDRGYLWAKSRLDGPGNSSIDARQPNNRTIKTDAKVINEVWKVARAATRPRSSQELADLFQSQERLPPDEASAILSRAEGILRKEPNLIELKPPVIIVGDIHGQFFDLLNLLKIAGFGEEKKKQDVYLFLGDYVDRGDFSCEVLLYLMCLKAEYPKRFFFLRGNHEARSVSGYFGFKKEAEAKYGLTMFNRACSVFQAMPIACVLATDAGRWLCCHGGISPNITSLAQFQEFNRFIEPGMNGFLCDLLWSDPIKDTHEDGSNMSLAEFLSIEYLPNPVRGCSYRFGFKSVLSFLAVNNLVGIIRAHEVIQNGYKFHFQRSDVQYLSPPVVTVFSAPNYCGRYGNRGAMLRINAKPAGGRKRGVKPMELIEPIVFSEVSHPTPMPLEINKQSEIEGRIAEMCPYMPTTFQGFLERSLELAHLQIEVSNAELAAANMAKALPTLIEEEQNQEAQQKKRPISFRGALPGRLRGMSAVVRKVTDPIRKFHEAAQNDSVNELNPTLLHDKVEKAKQMNIAFMSGLEDASEAITVVVLPTHHEEKVDELHKKDPSKLERRTSIQTVSKRELRAGSSTGEDNASVKSMIPPSEESDVTITFSSNEVLALQLLFLLIDRQDKNAIDVDDLIFWSTEAGHTVHRAEAQACLNALDVDRDGRIGFVDYLSFAARAKDQWLLQKYVEVKIQ